MTLISDNIYIYIYIYIINTIMNILSETKVMNIVYAGQGTYDMVTQRVSIHMQYICKHNIITDIN